MRIRSKAVTVSLLAAALGLAGLSATAAMKLSPGVQKGSPPSESPAASGSAAPAPIPDEKTSSAGSPAPAPTAPKSGQLAPPKKIERTGAVIYVGGAGVVGEIKGGVKPRERFRLYDAGSRLKGDAVSRKALDEATFLLEPVGGVTAAVGDRLVRVGE